MTTADVPKMVGARIKRREDPRLITGHASYVDDIVLPRMTFMVFARSEHAHAKIANIDTSKAKAMPGVLLVVTAADLPPVPVPGQGATPDTIIPPHLVLATDTVRHVGDPVALVVAEERYLAQDAADAIEITYEPLPVVVDPEQAMRPGAPQLHAEAPNNVAYVWAVNTGDADQAFRDAPVVVKQKMASQRLMGMPLETRASLADYRPGADTVTLWTSTQTPHLHKAVLAQLTGIPEDRVRVIAPEVGGGFGVKIDFYAEEILSILVSKMLGRPVKWSATRSESFQSTVQGRGQIAEYELAADREGKVLGLRGHIIADMGAYLQTFTAGVPTFSGLMMPGLYDIRNLDAQITGVFTNKAPTGAYRGAGRPEATYYIERMMDVLADELGMDPVEVRRRNFIPAEQFPYNTATGLVYDTGNYEPTLQKCLDILGYDELRREQQRKREQGIYMGIGISTWVEICGMGPSAAFPGIGGWEFAAVKVDRTGKVTVYTGTSPHGQGQETAFAQIVADQLGIPVEDISVVHGDTAMVHQGVGTYGSRAIAVGGSAVLKAAIQVREKAKKFAAHLMDASEDDLEIGDGRIVVQGSPDRSVTWVEVAGAAYAPMSLPPDTDPGLEGTSYFEPPNFTYPFGAHAAVVEIEQDTGEIRLTRYVAVDDCGTVINPLLVEGQIHGGIAQGVGQALTEGVVYGDNGQLITGTLMDYAVPTAELFPRFETANTVTTTPVNPLGAKGIGEAGTIAATPTVVNAVVDALAPFGVHHVDMPLHPEKVWGLMNQT